MNKTTTKMSDIILAIVNTICILLILWALVSYFEVICKNNTSEPIYNSFNLLYMIYGE